MCSARLANPALVDTMAGSSRRPKEAKNAPKGEQGQSSSFMQGVCMGAVTALLCLFVCMCVRVCLSVSVLFTPLNRPRPVASHTSLTCAKRQALGATNSLGMVCARKTSYGWFGACRIPPLASQKHWNLTNLNLQAHEASRCISYRRAICCGILFFAPVFF